MSTGIDAELSRPTTKREVYPTVFRSDFGGGLLMYPRAGTRKQWAKGKCWSCICGNPIMYIHISKSGYATHGYCHDTYESYKEHALRLGWPERGKWFLFANGRLEEDQWERKPKENTVTVPRNTLQTWLQKIKKIGSHEQEMGFLTDLELELERMVEKRR